MSWKYKYLILVNKKHFVKVVHEINEYDVKLTHGKDNKILSLIKLQNLF